MLLNCEMTYISFLIEYNLATQITIELSLLDLLIKQAYLELELDSFTTINELSSSLIESNSIEFSSCSFHLTALNVNVADVLSLFRGLYD